MDNPLEKKPAKKIEEFVPNINELEKIMDKLMQQIVPDLQANLEKPAIIGFSLQISSDGKPFIEEFGNVSKQGTKTDIAKVREPLVDIQLAEKKVFVTVELPGVEKKEIKLNNADEQSLEIIVAGTNSFYKKIVLPEKTKKGSAIAKFKNGILEIIIERKEPEKKGSGIKIG